MLDPRLLGQRWLFRTDPGPLSRAAATWVGRLTPALAPGPAVRPAVPTIVVGGLAVGGAGRTPVVAWLARAWADLGLRVAVVTHGYRATARHPVALIEPDIRSGDEAAELRRTLPLRVAVWGGPDRRATLVAVRDADVVVVDGGLLDHTLPCTARIAVVDATAPRSVWPAGPLRAPLAALARADAVWLHRVDEPGARPLPAPWAPRVQSRVAFRGVRLPDGSVAPPTWLAGRAVRPLTGIARPGSFLWGLAQAGAEVLPGLECADHHVFRPAELAACLRRGGTWVTTAKDAERLPPGWPAVVVDTEVAVVAGDADGLVRWLAS